MADLANNDYIRVRIYNEDPGRSQVAINTLFYKIVNIVGTWTPASLAASLATAHAPLFRAWQSPATKYNGTGVARYSPNPTPEFRNTTTAGVGTVGTTTYPTQVTGLIGGRAADYHTGSSTSKHPAGVQVIASSRIYVSFPSVSLAVGSAAGAMSDTQFNQLKTMVAFLYTQQTIAGAGLSTITLAPQIRWSTVTLPPVVVRTFSFSPVDTFYASRLWATQRRRGDRGQHEAFSV